MDIIEETSDYSKFELLPFNRNINRTKALEMSMLKYGFLKGRALDVIQNGDGKLKIKDGHHRFYVARKLNIPVKYIVDNSPVTVRELDDTVKKWTMQDWVAANTRERNPDYLTLRNYADETGLSITTAAAVLSGVSVSHGAFNTAFKDGFFEVTQMGHANRVKDILLLLKGRGVKFYNVSNLVYAISNILLVKSLNLPQFVARIKSNINLIERRATVEQYLELFEAIYNRHSNPKMPLKFMAEAAAKNLKG